MTTITIEGQSYVTADEAAHAIFGEYTQKTRLRVYKAMHAGKLRYVKQGRVHYLHAGDVQAYAALPTEERNRIPRAKPTMWNGKLYLSNSEAARAVGITPSAMLYRQAQGWRSDEDMGLSPREIMQLPFEERQRLLAEAVGAAQNEDFEVFEAFGEEDLVE